MQPGIAVALKTNLGAHCELMNVADSKNTEKKLFNQSDRGRYPVCYERSVLAQGFGWIPTTNSVSPPPSEESFDS